MADRKSLNVKLLQGVLESGTGTVGSVVVQKNNRIRIKVQGSKKRKRL